MRISLSLITDIINKNSVHPILYLVCTSSPLMTIRLDLSVLNVSIEEVKPLIRQIRPGWEMKDIKRTIFNEGLTNSLGAFYRDTIKDNDTVVIRINGATPFLDRQKEVIM